jgi:hypothetical protein
MHMSFENVVTAIKVTFRVGLVKSSRGRLLAPGR